MSTTVQVDEETLQRLREAKARTGARSYDELLRQLLSREAAEGGSLLGAHPEMRPFRHEATAHGE